MRSLNPKNDYLTREARSRGKVMLYFRPEYALNHIIIITTTM
jgi:hypothetical protein